MKSLFSKICKKQGWIIREAIRVRAAVRPLQSAAVEAHHLAGIIACVPVHVHMHIILAMHVESHTRIGQGTLEVQHPFHKLKVGLKPIINSSHVVSSQGLIREFVPIRKVGSIEEAAVRVPIRMSARSLCAVCLAAFVGGKHSIWGLGFIGFRVLRI